MVCYCAYFAFIDDEDMSKFFAWLRRQSRRFDWVKQAGLKLGQWRNDFGQRPEWQTYARAAFAVAIPLAALIGVQVEYQSDLFGERRPEGRHKLAAIDPDRARILLASVTPQRDIDKFFAVDMGTFLISDLLADRRTSFQQGEKLIAQCNLIPPHEDMVVTCKIRDSENRMIDRLVTIATREMFRANIVFQIPNDISPGEYFLHVETAGRHVMKDSRLGAQHRAAPPGLIRCDHDGPLRRA